MLVTNKLHSAIVLACITVSLSGCNTLGSRGSHLWHITASDSEKYQFFESQCTKYGFRKGTPEMSNCIANEWRDSKNAARERARSSSSRKSELDAYHENERDWECIEKGHGVYLEGIGCTN
jgi:hypothetical protein